MSDVSAPFDPARPHGPRRPPQPPGMTAADCLLAYEEIRQLAARYALAMDARDFDALVALFAGDLRLWDGRIGREPLRKIFEASFRRGMGGRVGFSSIGQHVINLFDADHAAGSVYCTAEFGDLDRWVRQAIIYEDTYERRDAVWYFTAREHQLVYGIDLDIRPLDQPEAAWPMQIVGVGTIPYAWRSWQAWEQSQATNSSIGYTVVESSESGGSMPITPNEYLEGLDKLLKTEPARTEGLQATFSFTIDGETGGQWWVEANNGAGQVHVGSRDDADVTVQLTDEVFVGLATGTIDGAAAYFDGLMTVGGRDQSKAIFLGQLFGG